MSTNISAAMVKELRERTGAGMMECKKALLESNGDLEAAVVAMRKSGQAKAAKRAGKVAAEGVIAVKTAPDNKMGFIIEVNSETDFVARSEQFKSFVEQVAKQGLLEKANDIAALLNKPFNSGSGVTLEQTRQELVAKVGENVHVRRVKTVTSPVAGFVGSYQHGDRIGVLIALDQNTPELAREIAMHIAATNPVAIHADDVPKDVINKEKEIFIAQAKETGKPDNIIEKMVVGRVDKFLKEICLLSQPFVKDPEQTIESLLKKKETKVLDFVRFEVGEGIEKQELDFAEEVKAMQGDK